jgi:hypothetical protein
MISLSIRFLLSGAKRWSIILFYIPRLNVHENVNKQTICYSHYFIEIEAFIFILPPVDNGQESIIIYLRFLQWFQKILNEYV